MGFSKKKKIVIGVIIVVALLIIAGFSSFSGDTDIALYDPPLSDRSESYDGGPSDYDDDMMVEEMAAPMMAEGMSKSVSDVMPPREPSGGADIEEVTKEDRLVIKSAQLSVVTKDVPAAAKGLTEYAQSVGGFVVEVDLDDLEDSPSATVTMRIPVEQFDAALGKVRESGIRVVSESVEGEDVTEEYVDSEAQLKSLEASEQQFMEIMKQAVNVEEVLLVQRELEKVRSKIERIKGRMQYMERSAKLSTITVYLSSDAEDLPVVNPSDKWQPIVIIKGAFRSLLGLFKGLGNILIWIAVFIPIWVPAWLIVRWYRRRKRQTVPKKPVAKKIG